MPLVYQGHLIERGAKLGIDEAFTAGEGWLAPATHHRRVDLWMAWHEFERLQRCARNLPEGFDRFWMDVTARANPRMLARYFEWARTLRGGRLVLHSMQPDREVDLSVELAGAPVFKVDDAALDPRRPHLREARRTVSFAEGGDHTAPGSGRRAAAIGRVRAAFEMMRPVLPELPPFEAWLEEQPPNHPIDPEQVRGVPAVPTQPPALAPVDPDEASLRCTVVAGAPYGLHLRLPESAADRAVGLFEAWLALAEPIDAVSLRCRGTISEIGALLDAFDLHDPPDRPNNSFGVSTLYHPERLEDAQVAALVEDPLLADARADWGLRWSDLRWRLDPPLDAPDRPDRSFYFIRPERGRVFDNLSVTLELEDADQPAFRRARRTLASALGTDLGNEMGWQYEGPPAETPLGERYAAVCEALVEEAAAVTAAAAQPVPADPPKRAPGVVQWLRGLRRGRRRVRLNVAGTARQILPAALPGFRPDTNAHATDRYFISFVRATERGFHYIELQRSHRVPGHTVRLGVSRYRMRLEDLVPTLGCAVPGLAIDLAELVPERRSLEWRYTSAAEVEAAMTDTATVLAARAQPFFDRAEHHMAALADEETTGADAE